MEKTTKKHSFALSKLFSRNNKNNKENEPTNSVINQFY